MSSARDHDPASIRTDADWLVRLEQAPLDQWPVADVRFVRRRLFESPEFAEALLSHPSGARWSEQLFAWRDPDEAPQASLDTRDAVDREVRPRLLAWMMGLTLFAVSGLLMGSLLLVSLHDRQANSRPVDENAAANRDENPLAADKQLAANTESPAESPSATESAAKFNSASQPNVAPASPASASSDGSTPSATTPGTTPSAPAAPATIPPPATNPSTPTSPATSPAASTPPTAGPPNATAPPATPAAVKPAAPPPPWQELLAATDEPRTFLETCWDGFEPKYSPPSREWLQNWFEPVAGHGLRWTSVSIPNGRCGAFEGVMRFKGPLGDEHALRLALDGYSKLQIHLFSGLTGVSLAPYHDEPFRWAAYATERDAGKSVPRSWRLLTTDAGRARRTEMRLGGPWELRHRDGYVCLSRGDILLMRAPLAGKLDEVVFQGRAVVHGLTMVRTSDGPNWDRVWPSESSGPLAENTALPSPAGWTWTASPNDDGRLEKQADGGLQLLADGAKQRGWVVAQVPPLGLHELQLQVRGATPGAGVFVGTEKDAPTRVLRFLHDRRGLGMSLAWVAPDDTRETSVPATTDAVAPLTASDVSIRLVVGCGVIRTWISQDARHWVELQPPARLPTRNLTHVGLHHVAGAASCRMTLQSASLIPLPECHSLADERWTSAADQVATSADLATWDQAAKERRPPEADSATWLRTCIVRTLTKGPDPGWGFTLVQRLLDESVATLPLERQLALLAELATVIDAYESAAVVQEWSRRFHDAGQLQFDRDGSPPISSIRRAWQSVALESRLAYPVFDGAGLRMECLQQMYADQWANVVSLARMTRFFHQHAQVPLLDWAEETARRATPERDPPAMVTGVAEPRRGFPFTRRPPRRTRSVTGVRDNWLHPLKEDLGKDAYNVIADLDGLLEAAAFDDAARAITSLAPAATPGIAPLDADENLLVSIPAAANWFVSRNPELSDAMRQRFAEIGELRVRAAMQTGEPAAIQLASVQFQGTPAAATAHRWLGDRALAFGDLAAADVFYRRAEVTADAKERDELTTRRRLLAALRGATAGESGVATKGQTDPSAARAVTLGDRQVSAEQFEQIIADLARRSSTTPRQEAARVPGIATVAAPAIVAAVKPDAAPNPNPAPNPETNPPTSAPSAGPSVTVQVRGPLDGPLGDQPQDEVIRNVNRLEVDWAGRQIGWVIEGDRLLVNNRFQVAAYQLSDGARAWQTAAPAGKKMMRARDWGLMAMQPRLSQGRVYARLLYGDGPLLGCWNAADGQSVWLGDTLRSGWVVSDPWIVQDRVLAMTISKPDAQDWLLRLTTWDANSGDVLGHADLVRLRSVWMIRRCCETALVGDTLIASLAGCVVACDLQGQVRWVRRQVVLPPDEEPDWVAQAFEPPLLRGDRLIVTQPGVSAVECLALDSGGRHWSRFVPGLRRVIGTVDDRAIVLTDKTLEALSLADGSRIWRRDMKVNTSAQWCADGGPIVFVELKPTEDGKKHRPHLNWLDPVSGESQRSVPLESLDDPAPRLGPLIPHADRLWAWYGRGPHEPKRELIEISLPK